MDDYTEVVNAWKELCNRYFYQDMPFFRVIVHYFYKDSMREYITANEMKSLIFHYKNALNDYKRSLLETDFKENINERKYFYLRKKIQLEYENLLLIYDDLVTIEDMKNGRDKSTTRTTTTANRQRSYGTCHR